MPPLDEKTIAGGLGTDVLEREEVRTDHGWNVLLWNDPVNLVGYVVMTLMRVLTMERDAAEQLTLAVHTDGKGVVFNGTQAEAEAKVAQLCAATLWATMERA